MKSLVLAVALIGCAKHAAPPPAPGSGSAPPAIAPRAAIADASIDAAPVIDAYVDPDPNRRGRRTGLTKGERPEVATEELVRALAVGNVPLADLIDPARGVYERIDLPGARDTPGPEIAKRLCGPAAVKATAVYLKRMLEAEVRGHRDTPDDSAHVFECTNEFLDKPDPSFGSLEGYDDDAKPGLDKGHPYAYAQCTSPHIMEWDEGFHVLFVKDPKRGLVVVAIVSTEGGAITYRLWNEVAKTLTSPAACT